MKTQLTPLLLSAGLVAGLGLSSCVSTYDAYGPGQASTVTTFHEPGYQLSTLPGGYRTERISGSTYYYHDGAYYRPRQGGYVVVDAPSSSRYYSDYDTYRRRTVTQREVRGSSRDPRGPVIDERRIVTRSPGIDERRVVTRLPSGYRTVTHRGTQYYQAGDSFYQRQGSGYTVVARPY